MRWKTISLDNKITDKTGVCRLSLHNKNKTKLKEIKAKATSTLALVIAGEYSDCCVSSVGKLRPWMRQKSDKRKMFVRGRGVLLSVLNWMGRFLFVFGSCVCVFKVKTCWWMGGVHCRCEETSDTYIDLYKHSHNKHNTSDASSTVMLSLASQLSFLFGIRHSGQLQGDTHTQGLKQIKQINVGYHLQWIWRKFKMKVKRRQTLLYQTFFPKIISPLDPKDSIG